jgi:hypothetical protein
MKLFVKLVLAILVLAMLLPFTLLKDDNGKPLMSFSDFSFPDFKLPDISLPAMPKISGNKNLARSDDDLSGLDLFYKWYDADGNVQFTTEPPEPGVEYKVKGFDPNANVIPAVKLPPGSSGTDEKSPAGTKLGEQESSANPYSQESIKKLFEDSENIQELLNQRLQNQESSLN